MNIAWESGTFAGLWEGVSLYRRRGEKELGTCWGGFSNQPNGNHTTLAQSGLFMCAGGVVCSCVQLVWPVHVCSWCGLFMRAAGVACSCVQLVWPVHVCTKYVASEISSCVKVGGRPGFLAVRTVSVEVKPH